jgi:hypothetical protein
MAEGGGARDMMGSKADMISSKIDEVIDHPLAFVVHSINPLIYPAGYCAQTRAIIDTSTLAYIPGVNVVCPPLPTNLALLSTPSQRACHSILLLPIKLITAPPPAPPHHAPCIHSIDHAHA